MLRSIHRVWKWPIFLLLITLCTAAPANARDAIRFAVPPWPGVTVKTMVVTDLLDALGYETKQEEVGLVLAYKGMGLDDVDASLAGWTPQQNPTLLPLRDKGELELLRENVDGALIGLCVPDYVYDAGVRSVADLDPNAERFGRTIYNLEAGSGMNTSLGQVLEADVAGLGDWDQLGITAPMMLAQVSDMIKEKDWVVFGCWSPHWMHVAMDVKYLDAVPGSEPFVTRSRVYTVVRTGLDKDFPEIYEFLSRFQVPAATQDQWIYDYSHRRLNVKKVARSWIENNMDMVLPWFEGLHTVDGKPAQEALQAAFAK